MDKIELIEDSFYFSFGIDKIKVFYGYNYLTKIKMINIIDKNINNINSEYDKETNKVSIMKFNDEKINSNGWIYFNVNANFDVYEDIKLSSKSLLLKYLEYKLENIEYNETFNMIKCLLFDLKLEVINQEIEFNIGDTNVNFTLEEFTKKEFIKMLCGNLITQDYKKRNVNLTYEEKLMYQLNLIEEISKKSEKNILLSIDSYLSEKIINKIKSMNLNNLFIIILYNTNKFDIKDYCLINNKIIDCSIKEELYNFLFNNLNFYINPNDTYAIISKYLDDSYSQIKYKLKEQL